MDGGGVTVYKSGGISLLKAYRLLYPPDKGHWFVDRAMARDPIVTIDTADLIGSPLVLKLSA